MNRETRQFDGASDRTASDALARDGAAPGRNTDIAALEREVESAARMLARLPAVAPLSTDAVSRIRSRILVQAAAERRRLLTTRTAMRIGGIAAAVVLSVSAALWPAGSPHRPDAALDGGLDDWTAAMKKSHDTVVNILTDDGFEAGGDAIEDFNRAVAELDSLGV